MTRKRFGCFRVITVALLLVGPCRSAIADVDPGVVMAGVRASRLALTQGTLRIRNTVKGIAEERQEEVVYLIEW